jgi:hypothetical protein
MQITYMEWYMGVFQSRLSEIISSKQMKECHTVQVWLNSWQSRSVSFSFLFQDSYCYKSEQLQPSIY